MWQNCEENEGPSCAEWDAFFGQSVILSPYDKFLWASGDYELFESVCSFSPVKQVDCNDYDFRTQPWVGILEP